jgi:menaquinone-dependent protoporphyrinogen oxidase
MLTSGGMESDTDPDFVAIGDGALFAGLQGDFPSEPRHGIVRLDGLAQLHGFAVVRLRVHRAAKRFADLSSCAGRHLILWNRKRGMNMRVLVVHASRYGATQGIAEHIAGTLRQHGVEATVQSAEQADDPADYAAAVIGSAVYFGHWMKPATEFARGNSDTLANRPVWLFSSGPLGTEAKRCAGSRPARCFGTSRDRRVSTDHQAAGPPGVLWRIAPKQAGVTHGLVMKFAKHANAPFPDGDFRDWSDIEAWGNRIAQAVKALADAEQSSIPLSVSVTE